MATINLNKNASAMIGQNTKVRVRILNYVLQIRPTNRVLGRNLPKGEKLTDLKLRADRGTFRFEMPDIADLQSTGAVIGQNFQIVEGRHGWLSLIAVGDKIPTKIGEAAPAGASFTAK